ncbi:hypothetical protein A2U01_0078160, partial [Trifolium medium]|nr:hypothetical protein [Trifolium medium]
MLCQMRYHLSFRGSEAVKPLKLSEPLMFADSEGLR